MIYQHVNKRTAMLSLATSHIAHLCKQLNHVALPISMPRFKKHYFFIKIALKLNCFWKKCKIFEPRASGSWGLRPQTPKTAPPLRISGYTPVYSSKSILKIDRNTVVSNHIF